MSTHNIGFLWRTGENYHQISSVLLNLPLSNSVTDLTEHVWEAMYLKSQYHRNSKNLNTPKNCSNYPTVPQNQPKGSNNLRYYK